MPKVNRKLTETEIRNAKGKPKPYKLYDEGGLRLLVRPSGTQVWQYPYKYNGKANIYTIGQVGEISSGEARRMCEEIKKLLKEGLDPNRNKLQKRQSNIEQHRDTFEAFAKEWYAKQQWAEKHAKNILSRMNKDVFPHIGNQPITKITALDMTKLLQRIENRGALDVARRINQYCSLVFDYAISKGVCENNPAIGRARFLKPVPRKNRPHLKAADIPAFLAKIEAYQGEFSTRLAFKLLFYTLLRPGELRAGRWNQISLEEKIWEVPPENMKMKRAHLVPLSPQAIVILKHLRQINGDSELLFPSLSNHFKPISDAIFSKAILIMGYRGKMSAHGMRHSASTILHEHGFEPRFVEKQLSHENKNKIAGRYNKAEFIEQRREMMDWWGDYLENLSHKGVDNAKKKTF
jgi:integrase